MMLPLLLLVHVAQRRARGQERAVEMDRQQLLPFGEVEFDDRRDDLDAGIADQNVEPPKASITLRGAGFDLFFVGDVHGDADRALAVRIDVAGGGLGRFLVRSAMATLGAFAGEEAAISLPIPLAAPVTIATLSSSCIVDPPCRRRCSRCPPTAINISLSSRQAAKRSGVQGEMSSLGWWSSTHSLASRAVNGPSV